VKTDIDGWYIQNVTWAISSFTLESWTSTNPNTVQKRLRVSCAILELVCYVIINYVCGYDGIQSESVYESVHITFARKYDIYKW